MIHTKSSGKALHTELVGKLNRTFDPQKIAEAIPEVLDKWLQEKGLLY